MKLSTCKHCGSPAHLIKNVTDPHLCWSVACSNLDCGISTRSFSQQDVAVEVWQRTAYSHRNGEVGTPTTHGKYWFDGIRTHAIGAVSVADIVTVGEDGEIDADAYWTSPVLAWDGKWWGPLPQPWDDVE